MLTEHTETLQRFSYEGPLTTWQGVLVGIMLGALAFWALYRVPRRARRKISPLLWLLRLTAIAVLVWMLLGPENLTVHRHVSPRSIAIVSDVSNSMDVFDPADAKSDLRWNAVNEDDSGSRLPATCDRAAAAAATARDALDWIIRNPARRDRPRQALRKLKTANQAISGVVMQIDRTVGLLGDNQETFPAELLDRAKDISSRVGGLPLLPLDDIEQLEEAYLQIVRSVRSLNRLSGLIADRLAADGGGPLQVGSVTRREKVNQWLEAAETGWLADHYHTARVRRYTFDSKTMETAEPLKVAGSDLDERSAASPVAATGRTSFTNLSSAIERINRDSRLENFEAVVLLTDGRHNDPQAADPRDVAKLLNGIPIHVVPVGSSEMRRDLSLHHLDAPSTVVEGDQVVVEAILSAYDCSGETCRIELREGDTVVAGEEIEIASVRRDSRIRLTTTPKKLGRHEYSLVVGELDREAVATNNAVTFGVDVVDATLRILVADSFPRWEFRYLINLFERDERIEYDRLLFHPKAPRSGKRKRFVRLPRDVDGWARYRVAILGDLSPAQFDAESQRVLKEYVTVRGGTVLLIAGTESMPHAFAGLPLEDLVPVSESALHDRTRGYQLELSPEGRMTSAMQIADEPGETESVWREMSRRLPVYSLSRFCVAKPASRTLIRAVDASMLDSEEDEKAFLCWQQVGRGRVVYIAAPTVYQLRLKHGDRFHHRFWGQLIRWAVARDLAQGSKTVKLTTDRTRISVGENIQIVANLSSLDGEPVRDAAVHIRAAIDNEPVSIIELFPDRNIPGRYLGEFAPADDGMLGLQAFGTDVIELLLSENFSGNIETSVMVDPVSSTETEDTRVNRALLRQIAKLTGGQLIPPTALKEIVGLMNLEPQVEEETVRGPLWNRWFYLWLMFGCLALEWTLRKATGLP